MATAAEVRALIDVASGIINGQTKTSRQDDIDRLLNFDGMAA